MEIIAITVCVQYDDILERMLEQNAKFLHTWFIVTSPDDTNTIRLIETSGIGNIKLLLYTDFYKNKAKFNFGGARLFAQDHIDKLYSSANVLFLDGDIYLPDNFRENLPSVLEDDTLYGSHRTYYWTLKGFNDEKESHAWKRPNFEGFFQLYKQNEKYRYADSYNCSRCDDIFKGKFPKKIMLEIRVKHLGKNGEHWNGRKHTNEMYHRVSIYAPPTASL